MTTITETEQPFAVTVTFPEILGWGREYEAFVDLLAEKIYESYVTDDEIEPHEVLVVGEYAVTGLIEANVMSITGTWVVDR